MKRLRRWLFNLTMFPLVLCLATSALWIRSEFFDDEYTYRSPKGATTVRSFDGAIEFFTSRFNSKPVGWTIGVHFYPAETGWMDVADMRLTVPYFSIFVWTAAMPFGFYFLPWVRAGAPFNPRRLWRMRNGLCLNCGYDLRATPDRCPEC